MDRVLNGIIEDKCMVYMDEIIIYGETEIEHDKNLKEVLRRLSNNNMKVNYKKMQYKDSKVKLLGYLIDGKKYNRLENTRGKS